MKKLAECAETMIKLSQEVSAMSRNDLGEEIPRYLTVTVTSPTGAKLRGLTEQINKSEQIADGIEILRITPLINIGKRGLPPEFMHQYVIEISKGSAISAAPAVISSFLYNRLEGKQVSLEIQGLGVDPDDEAQIRRTSIKKLEKRTSLQLRSREKKIEGVGRVFDGGLSRL